MVPARAPAAVSIRRKGPAKGGKKAKGRVLTGNFGSTIAPRKRGGGRPPKEPKDKDVGPVLPGMRVIHAHSKGKLPLPIQLLRDRDSWLNQKTYPRLTGLGITLDRLAVFGVLLAQGAPFRSLVRFSPAVTRETLLDPAVRLELFALRGAFEIAMAGMLKTSLWTSGVQGDVQAARTWLETQGALRPVAPPRGTGETLPAGVMSPSGEIAVPRAEVSDVLLRLASIYMEARAVSDLDRALPAQAQEVKA